MFNALRYSKDLEAAGFSREQAEATIDVFFKFMEHNFATKEDIRQFAVATKADIQQMATKEEVHHLVGVTKELDRKIVDLQNEFRSMELKMTIKFGLMQTAGVAVLAAIIKLF